MTVKKILPWFLVGGVLWYLTNQSKKFDIGGASISRIKLEGNGIRVNIKLAILNRSDFTAVVQGFLGQIFYGTNSLGTVTLQGGPQEIPSFQTSNIEFTALISYAGVGLELWNWLKFQVPGQSPEENQNTQVVNWEDFSVRGTLRISDIAVEIASPIFA